MKLHDSILAAAFLLLAIAVVSGASGLPPAPGQPVGPALFPTAIGIALGIGSALLLVRSLRTAGPRVWFSAAPELRQPRIVLGFVLAAAAVVFYLVASEPLGFLPCSVLILIVLFTVFGVRLRLGVPLAFAASFAIYAMFSRLLAVPLPPGILEGIL